MTLEHAAIILSVAALTFLTRIAGFQIGDHAMPPAVVRALDVAPIAAFAALVVPGMDLGGSGMLPRLAGLTAAGGLFVTTGRLFPGLICGMAVYAGVLLVL